MLAVIVANRGQLTVKEGKEKKRNHSKKKQKTQTQTSQSVNEEGESGRFHKYFL